MGQKLARPHLTWENEGGAQDYELKSQHFKIKTPLL